MTGLSRLFRAGHVFHVADPKVDGSEPECSAKSIEQSATTLAIKFKNNKALQKETASLKAPSNSPWPTGSQTLGVRRDRFCGLFAKRIVSVSCTS